MWVPPQNDRAVPLAREVGLEKCRWPLPVLKRLEEVHFSLEWLHGPEEVSCGRDEFVVLCVVRNGALWLRSYLEHYRKLGARHFFFLDNGSTDPSVEIMKSCSDVTVLRSLLPYSERFLDFSRYLFLRFGHARWSLHADVDEFFDYPGSERRKLGEVLEYMRRHDFTALRTHMIDMFSDQPLGSIKSSPEDDLRDKYRFCDVSDLWQIEDIHASQNSGFGQRLPYLIGGIRKTVFGTHWIYLTKHPLLFDAPSLTIPDPHALIGASIADFNGMFWHYKFLESFSATADDILRRWQGIGDVPGMEYYHRELEAYVQISEASPHLSLRRPTSVTPHSASQFVSASILKASPQYLDFVAGLHL